MLPYLDLKKQFGVYTLDIYNIFIRKIIHRRCVIIISTVIVNAIQNQLICTQFAIICNNCSHCAAE